jgi:hypothetical protein
LKRNGNSITDTRGSKFSKAILIKSRVFNADLHGAPAACLYFASAKEYLTFRRRLPVCVWETDRVELQPKTTDPGTPHGI